MTRKRPESIKRRVERFFARRVLYEEDGIMKIFELPEEVPFAEAIRRFEEEKGLRADPELGVWCRVARRQDATSPETQDASPTPNPTPRPKRPRAKGGADHDA